MRVITVAALLIVTTACGGSPTPQPQSAASPTSQPEVLGPPATLPGTTLADSGEIEPADPSKFNKTPGYSPVCRSQLSRARLLRGRTRPHGLVGRRRRHRHDARTRGSGAVRSRRRSRVDQRSAREARQTARLDRRHRPLRRHGRHHRDRSGNAEMMQDATIKRWHDMFAKGGQDAKAAVMELIAAQSSKKLPPLIMDPKFAKAVWDKNIAIQEKYNEPGRFTAFIAYEWTSNAGGGDNLHRNVIYRDGKSKAEQVLPMTTFQSENPEDLWKWMAAWEQKTGGKLLAIPHNGNLSNGRMFPLTHVRGRRDDQAMGRGPSAMGAALRSDPDEGPERVASVALDDRRVRGELRALGSRQPDADAEEAGHDPGPVPARGVEEWLEGRTGPRSQSVQIRDGGWHRYAQRIGRRGRGQLLCASFRPPNRTPTAGTKTP